MNTVSKKLYLLFGILFVLMIIIGSVASYSLITIKKKVDTATLISSRLERVDYVKKTLFKVLKINESYGEGAIENQFEFEALFSELESHIRKMEEVGWPEDEHRLLSKIKANLEPLKNKTSEILRSSDPTGVSVTTVSKDVLLDALEDIRINLINTSEIFFYLVKGKLEETRYSVEATRDLGINATILISFFSFFFGGAAVLIFARRNLVGPIKTLEQAAIAIGEEKYDTKIDVVSKDEIGTLARTFEGMAGRLKAHSRSLRKSEERTRLILESAGEGIYGLDLEGNTTFCNPAAEKMLGYSLEEMSDQSQHALIHHSHPDGSHYPREECLIYAALKDGEVHHVSDEVFWRKDGSSFPVEYVSTPIVENNIVRGAVVVFKDISEQKAAEKELKNSHSKLERLVAERTADLTKAYVSLKENKDYLSLLITNMVDGLITINDKGIIKMVNPEVESLFGYSSNELVGKNVSVLMPEPDRSKHDQYIQNYLATGKAKVIGLGREVEAMKKDGTIFSAHLGISPIYIGNKTSYLGIIHDLTKRMEIEQDLRDSKETAEKANKAKSEFLSRMSHELRTPLNAILGFSQLMIMNRNEKLTKTQESNSNHIIEAGNHLLELINEVLDLSKIEAGKFSIVAESLSASLMITECVAQTQPLAKERNIKTLNLLSQKGNHFVRADHIAFRQIMHNLLSNAVKYNYEGGSITVDGGASGNDNIWISVSDTGPGTAKENIEALFEPFNRLGQEFSEIEGTGIGLSISKSLAELMGGSLSAKCEPGKGCCFKVVLPAGSEESVSINTPAPDTGTAKTDIQLTGHTILYIEDNPQNLNLVEDILKHRPQITLLSAMHARDGIELARTHRPDLILMDIQLPEMDGIAAFSELQKFHETCDIPVIALSAQAMKEDINRVMNFGFKDYLTKPINITKFLETLDNILR